MKRFACVLLTFVITTAFQLDYSMAQSNSALDQFAGEYKACIKTELEVADNGDGTYDEAFFLEGKEHCDKIRVLQIDTARASQRIFASKERIAQMTNELISGAKSELGLQ